MDFAHLTNDELHKRYCVNHPTLAYIIAQLDAALAPKPIEAIAYLPATKLNNSIFFTDGKETCTLKHCKHIYFYLKTAPIMNKTNGY